ALVAARNLVLGQRFVWSWLYLPAALFVGYGIVQSLSLSPDLLKTLAPSTADLWRGVDSKSAPAAFSLSLFPAVTIEQLRVVLIASIVLVAVANLVRTRWQLLRLLGGIAIIGLAVAVLAALQDVTLATHVYWIGPPGRGMANAGPFIHYSHFGQFVNLCMFA